MEIYEDPARTADLLPKLMNSYIKDDPYTPETYLFIHQKLKELIQFEISLQHVIIIISSWRHYQKLINTGRSAKLKRLKRNIQKLIPLRDEILMDIHNSDLKAFNHKKENILAIFGKREKIDEFQKYLHRKNGSLYNKYTLTKLFYYELLFIGESFGLTPPLNYYKSSPLKAFLKIITEPLPKKYEPTEDMLEFYCQQYDNAKKQTHIQDKITALIEMSSSYRSNLIKWELLLNIYRNEISPLILSHEAQPKDTTS